MATTLYIDFLLQVLLTYKDTCPDLYEWACEVMDHELRGQGYIE